MDVAIAFLVGIFIGSAAGIFTFALLAAAKMEDEMIEFLKGMEKREKILQEEKVILRSSVETLEEAINSVTSVSHFAFGASAWKSRFR